MEPKRVVITGMGIISSPSVFRPEASMACQAAAMANWVNLSCLRTKALSIS